MTSIPFWINGRLHHLDSMSLTSGPAEQSVWAVVIDSSRGCGGTLEAALLLAARAAENAMDWDAPQ